MTIEARPSRRTLAAPSSTLPERCQRRQSLEARFERQQHGVAQMHAGDGVGEHVGEQQALIDFVPVLGAQRQLRFALQRRALGHQARVGDRGALTQCVGAQEARTLFGERVVDARRVDPQKSLARFARAGKKAVGRRCSSAERSARAGRRSRSSHAERQKRQKRSLSVARSALASGRSFEFISRAH